MNNCFNEMKNSIKEICAIESIQTDAVKDMPFGEGVYKALKYMLDLASEMGFETVNYDNYVGEVIWRGKQGEKTLGILCHVDVVKVGKLSDWVTPPFSPDERDGKIYARGTTDDKGPAVCVLYMMKQLKDSGFVPSKTIKLILGCNEESGWGCIDHYNKVAKMPDFGFSPDGDFPVLYAEKGIFHAKFKFECSPLVKQVQGGEMANVVCDYAYAVAPINESVAKECGVTINGEKIESFGVTAHGSTPEKGKNAIDNLLKYLVKTNMVDSYVYDTMFNDIYNLKAQRDETGNLTMSPDIIELKDGYLYITVDFRYPATLDPHFIENACDKIAPYTLVGKHQYPLFNDKNNFLIATLLKIYNEQSGTNTQPIAIGGGTYARALPVGCAFGPAFEDEECGIHQPNEFISIKTLEFMCKVYKKAIEQLAK